MPRRTRSDESWRETFVSLAVEVTRRRPVAGSRSSRLARSLLLVGLVHFSNSPHERLAAAPTQGKTMSVSSRLQCAVIAVAVLPCLATAQSGLVGNTPANAPGTAFISSARCPRPEIAVNTRTAAAKRRKRGDDCDSGAGSPGRIDPHAGRQSTDEHRASRRAGRRGGRPEPLVRHGWIAAADDAAHSTAVGRCDGPRRRSPRNRARRRADDHRRRGNRCRRDCRQRRWQLALIVVGAVIGATGLVLILS